MGELISFKEKFDESNNAQSNELHALLSRINKELAHFLKIDKMSVREKAALAEIVEIILRETETRLISVNSAIMNHALVTKTDYRRECDFRDRCWRQVYVQPAIERWLTSPNCAASENVNECVGHVLRVLRFNLHYNS